MPCDTVKCMANIGRVCPHVRVLQKDKESVCVCANAGNVFMIKLTECKGEVPLEGRVATYLHTHSHTYTHTHKLIHSVNRYFCFCVQLHN